MNNEKKRIFIKLSDDIDVPIQFKNHQLNISDFCKVSFLDNSKTLKHPFSDNDSLEKESAYLFEKSFEIISILSKTLNEIHNTNYPNEFWKITLNGWILTFICQSYDNYRNIIEIEKQYGNHWTTHVLDEQCHYTPNTSFDLIDTNNLTNTYNFQLLSKIIKILKNKNFPSIKRAPQKQKKHKRSTLLLKIILLGYFRFLRNRDVIIYSFLDSIDLIKILFKSKFQSIFYTSSFLLDSPKNKKNQEMRNKLKKINHHTKDPFVKCLINLIPDYLPKSFVENFKDYLTKSQTLFPKNPRSIISSGGLNFCDYAKIWIASNKIKGTPLSILQHGGGYLSSKISLIPFNEYRLCDQFLSWGWKVAESHPFRKKITPFYITKTHQINRKNNCKKILLITTNIPKSSFLLAHFNYFDIYHYMATQIKFINHLNTRRTKHLKLRLYKYDFGWKIKDYYKTHFPQIDIENSSTISLNKSLKTTKLVIIDHNSTSLLETLSKNIPTLLFWDKTMNQRISKDAQPFFKLLEDVQVLHTCPKSAALFVNDLNDNIEDWWQNPLRQKAIKEFCNKFAKKSNNLSSDIINKLINN